MLPRSSSPLAHRHVPPRALRCTRGVLLIILLGWPSVAATQELGEESRGFRYSDSVAEGFYTIEALPRSARLVLEGRNRLSGQSPLAVPADIRGTYSLWVTRQGYETQHAQLVLPGGGLPLEVTGPYEGIGPGSLSLALVWPGMAEMREGSRLRGSRLRGSTWGLAGAIGVGATIASHLRLHDEIDQLETARRAVSQGSDASARQLASVEVVRASATALQAEEARRDWAIATGAIWGLSLIDHFLLPPGLGAHEMGLTELSVELVPLSRTGAALRSIIPGTGQLYAGRPRAAALAMFSALAAGAGLLFAEHAYDEAVDRVAGLEQLYDHPQAEPETLEILRPILEDEVRTAESRQSTRDLMLGLAGGVWALGVIDAYLGTPAASPEVPFGHVLRPDVEIRPDGSLAAALRLTF